MTVQNTTITQKEQIRDKDTQMEKRNYQTIF